MGEKIKNLINITINESNFNVELNTSSNGDGQYEIHIQNSIMRIDMTLKQYIRFVLSMAEAEKNLSILKNENH